LSVGRCPAKNDLVAPPPGVPLFRVRMVRIPVPQLALARPGSLWRARRGPL